MFYLSLLSNNISNFFTNKLIIKSKYYNRNIVLKKIKNYKPVQRYFYEKDTYLNKKKMIIDIFQKENNTILVYKKLIFFYYSLDIYKCFEIIKVNVYIDVKLLFNVDFIDYLNVNLNALLDL